MGPTSLAERPSMGLSLGMPWTLLTRQNGWLSQKGTSQATGDCCATARILAEDAV